MPINLILQCCVALYIELKWLQMVGRSRDEREGVDSLFFELASESRLSILRELQTNSLRMQQVAHKLDLTDTEAFRQLQRLSEASLIQRQPDGVYAITQYGKLVMQLSRSLEVAYRKRQCFMTRNIWRLPDQFVNRLGELINTELSTDTLEMLNRGERVIAGAEKFCWQIGDMPVKSQLGLLEGLAKKGVEIKFLFPESMYSHYEMIPEKGNMIEKRTLPIIPAKMLLTESNAGVNLFSIDGRADAAIFYGSDPTFLGWVNDLFNYYWVRGNHCTPK